MRPAELDKLARNLERQVELLEQLKSAVENKRQALVKVDSAATEAACREENAILKQLIQQEESRASTFNGIAKSMGENVISLAQITGASPEPQKTRISATGTKLKKLSAEIARINELNAQLAAQSFSHSRTILNMLAGGGESQTYGNGNAATGRPVSSIVVDRRV